MYFIIQRPGARRHWIPVSAGMTLSRVFPGSIKIFTHSIWGKSLKCIWFYRPTFIEIIPFASATLAYINFLHILFQDDIIYQQAIYFLFNYIKYLKGCLYFLYFKSWCQGAFDWIVDEHPEYSESLSVLHRLNQRFFKWICSVPMKYSSQFPGPLIENSVIRCTD